MTIEKRKRGRPRREGADEEILAVALQMLREGGDRVLTVDAVAERAGVAKTTVYRRWPSKGALIAAAVAPLVAPRREEVEAVLHDLRTARQRLIELLGDEVIADGLIETILSEG